MMSALEGQQLSRRDINREFTSRNIMAPAMDEEEVENIITTFANEDPAAKKTWSRTIVEKHLSKYHWYFPSQTLPHNPPSLKKAYAYFEHVTLPRHIVGKDQAGHVLSRAEPGETNRTTELYPAFTTPQSSLIEWGIGVDLYFTSVRMLGTLLLLAGLLHLPNAFYYASGNYRPNGGEGLSFSYFRDEESIPLALLGTAMCTQGEWVVCGDTCLDQFENNLNSGQEDHFLRDGDTILVNRSSCEGGELGQGLVNLGVCVFLLITVFWSVYYMKAREVRFDEDKLTATDYSVMVKNPPPDAIDPQEWKDFFEQFDGKVTAITIALNNEVLLRKTILRRVHRKNLRMKLPRGVDLDHEDTLREAVAIYMRERDADPKGFWHKLFDATILPILHLIGMFLPADVLLEKVFDLTEEIKELQSQKYDAVKVFVTFETEAAQRTALNALSVSRLDVLFNSVHNIPPSTVFHDRVLNVDESKEPSTILWLDLSVGVIGRISWRVINFYLTIGITACAGYFVTIVRYRVGTWVSSIMVTVFNSTIPLVVKILMIFEKHHSEGTRQNSLYTKITLFRWINTAVLTKLLTPFTRTLSDRKEDAIRQINAILWSELWLTPGLRLLDISSNLKKHVLAPRARNQDVMNSFFQGTPYNLGERYTDLTKVLFVCFFYSALMPTVFFFGAAILFLQYYADKFCLTRIWGWTPSIGNELARFSRKYFFSGALLSYAIVSAYAFAQFPYDNVCDPDVQTPVERKTFSNLFFQNGTSLNATIVVEYPWKVEFCEQSFRSFSGLFFPPTSRIQPEGVEWMNDSQASLADIYGYFALILVVAYLVVLFGDSIRNFTLSWFHGVYEPDGQDQRIDFSSNTEIFGYVPQIRWGGFAFPLLACDIDEIDQGLIGWNDPHRSYDYYNLIFDVPWEGLKRTTVINENTRTTTVIAGQEEFEGADKSTRLRPIYSIIKHYPPEWALKLRDTADEN